MTRINKYYVVESQQCERDVFAKKLEGYLDKGSPVDAGAEPLLGGFCEEFASEQKRFDCYMGLLMDVRLCESSAPGGNFAMYCYDRYSRYDDSYACCYLLNNPSYCLSSYAVKLNNGSICALITDEWTREGCVKDVIKFGGSTLDRDVEVATCEAMESYNRDVCFNELARKYDDYSYCLMEEDGGPFCVSEIALKLDNATVCEKIRERSDVRASCYEKIAVNTGNVSLCEKCAADEYYLFSCFRHFFEPSHEEIDCGSKVSYEREYCLASEAVYVKNPSLCEAIETPAIRDVCRSYVAGELGDWEVCEKIAFSYEREDCLRKRAQEDRNYEICGKIEDRSSHDTCLNNVAFLTSTKEPCEHLRNKAMWYDTCGRQLMGQ